MKGNFRYLYILFFIYLPDLSAEIIVDTLKIPKGTTYLICKPDVIFYGLDSDTQNTYINFEPYKKEIAYSSGTEEVQGINVTLTERDIQKKLGNKKVWALYSKSFFVRAFPDLYRLSAGDAPNSIRKFELSRKTLKLEHLSTRYDSYPKNVKSKCKVVSRDEFFNSRRAVVNKLNKKRKELEESHEDDLQI